MSRSRITVVCAAGVVLGATSCTGPEDTPAVPTTPPVASTTPATSSSDPEPDSSGAFQSLDDYAAQELDWSACGDGFECATVLAPLDYADPTGDTIDLAVNRLPSTGTRERVGSLLLNPGGPGASGLEYARTPNVVSDAVLGAYDVVGFDPRGVGSSSPVECVGDAEFDAFIQLDASPETEQELAVLKQASEDFADACAAESGDLLPHVGTADVARDLDLLRSVLGDEELYYLGKSYGTLVGAVYADLFPERVGRLVLDGAVDPSQSAIEQGIAQAEGFDGALRAFAADCIAATECPLQGDADAAVEQVAAFFAELDEEPLATDDDRELGEALATYGVAVTLYDRQYGWPVLRTALAEAFDGDGTLLLRLSDLYFDREDGVYTSNANEVNAAVNCLDHGPAATVEEIRTEVPAYVERAPVFGAFVAYSGLVCAYWPVTVDEPASEITAAGAAPILVVGTTRDPATPYAAAVSLADQLESGVLLTYEGDGHTAYGLGSPCVDDAVDGYLLSGEPPPEGTTC